MASAIQLAIAIAIEAQITLKTWILDTNIVFIIIAAILLALLNHTILILLHNGTSIGKIPDKTPADWSWWIMVWFPFMSWYDKKVKNFIKLPYLNYSDSDYGFWSTAYS